MDRNAPLAVSAALTVLAVVLLVVSGVYFTDTAHALPGFFPGHVSATDPKAHHVHTTHGIAAAVAGVAALFGAWISSGKKARTT